MNNRRYTFGVKNIILITSPDEVKNEAIICNLLFSRGLQILHLRKPGFPQSYYEDFIVKIEPRYRKRIVIHDHFSLYSNMG